MATSALTGLASLGQSLGRIIGLEHARAVAAEANDLNSAVPNYQKNLVAIVQAFNGASVDASTASAAVDDAIAAYYSSVSGIIKDSSNSGNNCTSADASGTGSNCNGPCTVGCAWIVPWGKRVKAAILSGGASLSFSSIPAHAGFNGFPNWSIQVLQPSQPINTIGTLPPITPTPQTIDAASAILSPVSQTAGFAAPMIFPSAPLTRGSAQPLYNLVGQHRQSSNTFMLAIVGFVALLFVLLFGAAKK